MLRYQEYKVVNDGDLDSLVKQVYNIDSAEIQATYELPNDSYCYVGEVTTENALEPRSERFKAWMSGNAYSVNVNELFVDLYRKGHIPEGYYLVNVSY